MPERFGKFLLMMVGYKELLSNMATIQVKLHRDKARTQMVVYFSKTEEEFILTKRYNENEFLDFLEEELHYVNGSDYYLPKARQLWRNLKDRGWEEFN